MMRPAIFRDNVFDDFFGEFVRPAFDFAKYSAPNTGLMRTDIKDTETAYELDIDLPGYSKEDVTAELKEGYLTIRAEKKQDKDEKNENGAYIRRERFFGSCSRTFYVGDTVTEEDIKARFADGILQVQIPKKMPQAEVKKTIMIE